MEERISVLKSMDNIIRHFDDEYNDVTKLFFEICSIAYKDNNYSTWC